MNKILSVIQQGVWKENTALVQLLGLCPLLAVSTDAAHALGLGVATTLVLICTNTIVSLTRHWIIKPIRIPIYVMIIASISSSIQLLLNAYAIKLYQSLGIFIPLITTNCVVISRAEIFASKNNVSLSALDGLAVGIGIIFTLLLLGGMRELLSNGTLFYNIEVLFGDWAQNLSCSILSVKYFFLLARFPPGAFLGLGILLAIKQGAALYLSSCKKQ